MPQLAPTINRQRRYGGEYLYDQLRCVVDNLAGELSRKALAAAKIATVRVRDRVGAIAPNGIANRGICG